MADNDELLRLATGYLRQAVPLMMKHKIPATPSNYALWYTYVADEHPPLTEAINSRLNSNGQLNAQDCSFLYQTHLSEQTDGDLQQARLSLEAMASELFSSMSDTLEDTHSFRSVIDNSFHELQQMDQQGGMSLEDLAALTRRLLHNTREVQHSTHHFTAQLSEAQQEISRLKEQLQVTRHEAMMDALTGLHNRRAFDKALAQLLSDRARQPFCLLLLDLDNFKTFNDTYGHRLGDQVLKVVAQRLQEHCRGGARAYRYGGEEFAMLVPHRTLSDGLAQANAIRSAIERLSVVDRRSGKQINAISVSVGVAASTGEETAEQLFECADGQLYMAKTLGRNCVMPQLD